MSAGGRVEMARIPDAVVVPAQATFQKSGRTVVYVLDGKKFHEQPIEAGRRSGDQLMVAHGLKAGVRVALKDPTSKE
jgi:multidrug efflux pump subunit AcrA (membrane-fusion protein)